MGKRLFRTSLGLAIVMTLSACGGGGGGATPDPVVTLPVITPPDFTAVLAEIERHPVADMGFMIGDANGVLISTEKGSFTFDDTLRLASASKLLTGAAVWSLVEAGDLSLSDTTAELITGWPTDSGGDDVTLSQLLSFTSGFNVTAAQTTCAGSPLRSLQGCVLSIADEGPDAAAGETFSYGPEHMQIAALMARSATGIELSETLRQNILDPVGASDATGFFTGENTRYSGFATGTTNDYGKVLQALLAEDLFVDMSGFLADRSQNTNIFYSPVEGYEAPLDWHYGFGFWIECDQVPFNESCATTPTISSAGLFGFVPWVDFDRGYWAIIAVDVNGEAEASSVLQQTLQPMIEIAFAQ